MTLSPKWTAVSFFALTRDRDDFATVVAVRSELLSDGLKSSFTEMNCGCCALKFVVRVMQQVEMSTVLFKVTALGTDNGDRLF